MEYKVELSYSHSTGFLISSIITLFLITFALIYIYLTNNKDSLHKTLSYIIENPFIILILLYTGLIIQEIIRSITLLILRIGFNEQKFGFSFYTLMPYVTTKHPIKIYKYFFSLIIPLFCVLLLFTIFLVTKYLILSFVCILIVFFYGFDFINIYYTLKNIKKDYLVSEHNNKPGIVLYENPFKL